MRSVLYASRHTTGAADGAATAQGVDEYGFSVVGVRQPAAMAVDFFSACGDTILFMARRRHKATRKRLLERPDPAPISSKLPAPPSSHRGGKAILRTSLGWVVKMARTTRRLAAHGRTSLGSIPELHRIAVAGRGSLASIALYLRPADPTLRLRRRVRVAVYSLLALVLILAASRSLSRERWSGWWSRLRRALTPNAVTMPPVEVVAAAPTGQGADATLRRERPSVLRGGVLLVPSTFSSSDGAYDLVLHFHGDVKIVLESLEVAKVNALLGVINLGVGSGSYETQYGQPGIYEALLAQVQQVATDRGLKDAHLRRVALTSWSAGYGAISAILQKRQKTDPLDAVLMLDGLHCGRLPERPKELNFRQLAPFVEAARLAADGKLLFSITHSDIDPRLYVSTRETATYLIDAVREYGVEELALAAPAQLHLKAAAFAVDPKLVKYLQPTRDVRAGSFHVRGFTGETPEDHVAHLTQMGSTVLVELASRWSAAR